MSFAAERAAIESRLAANWTTTSIKFENTRFEQPRETAWIACYILNGDGNQISLGDNPLHRYAGVIMVQIFVPESSGTQTARGYADTIAAIYRRQQISNGSSGTITCRTPSISQGIPKDGWYQINVMCPFQRDVYH